jgi:Kdo2-lipid IVA lauroyltransferase/acyltransferase
MLERVALSFLWLLHFLPLRVLAALGNSLGSLLYRLGRERRGVALVNLKLCFPELSHAQRERIARAHFQVLTRVMLEQGILWWASNARFLKLVHIEGVEHWHAVRGQPVIWLAPHFLGLDMGGVRLSELTPTATMYSKQKNAVLERMLLKGRSRFNSPGLFSRQEGLRGALKMLKRGLAFYYLPDQDFGLKDAVFVPFFGVPAATITGLSRIAKLTGAKVQPVVTHQLPGGAGYVVRIYPAWEDFPTGDVVADARRMNAVIEQHVREMPEQYLWTHKRFKTRPPGEARIY